jgi:hypothetical protein
MGAAIDSDFVTAGSQSRREVFSEGFKSAVTCWYSSRAENRYTHKLKTI